ncbi:MAG: pilus assembly FimT family protein [Gemmatimonadales bacterium]
MIAAPSSRTGFSLVELIVALVIAGVLAVFAVPLARDLGVRESVRGARRAFITHLARARATAVQRGCSAVLHMDAGAGAVWLTACPLTSGGAAAVDTVGEVDNLMDRFGVSVTAGGDSVLYTPQGLAFAASSVPLTFSRGEHSASLEVTPVGRAVW